MTLFAHTDWFPIDPFGWFVFDGDLRSFVRDHGCPVVLQPASLPTAYCDAIAQGCRDHWIEKYHHLFAVAGVDQYLDPVSAGSDNNGVDNDSLHFAARVPANWHFKLHVSLPALQLGAGIGGLDRFFHGFLSHQGAAA